MKLNPISEFVRKYIYVLLGIVCLLGAGILYLFAQTPAPEVVRGSADAPAVYAPAPQGADAHTPSPPVESEPTYNIVHIVGAVTNPGVYSLPADSRVYHALQAAGGETDDADLGRINLATPLQDAMQIIIPRLGEDIDEMIIFAHPPAPDADADTPRININTATSADLQTLPNIGPAIAQNIIDFREAHGAFASVDELIQVTRIGAITLDRLRPLVTVD